MTAVELSSRRDEILGIAAAGFAQSGFEGCSVRDIAEKANILSGSLYHHFSSKDEMVVEILAGYWQRLFEAYDELLVAGHPPDVTLRGLVVASLGVAEQCPHEVRILHQDWHYLSRVVDDLDTNMAKVEQAFTETLSAGVDAGLFRGDIDPAIAYRTIMGAVSWVTRWHRPDGELSMTQVGELQATMWLDGLRRVRSARPT